MSSTIEILHPGMHSSIQDQGRCGYAFYAIPRSGVMDHNAYDNIRLILGTSDNISVIECTLQAPTIRFQDSMTIVISGAKMQWKINDRQIPLNTLLTVHQGDILKGGYITSGYRGYLGFSQKMEVSSHFGSVSSYNYAQLGANDGQPLFKNQIIRFNEQYSPSDSKSRISDLNNLNTFTFQKGPEYDWIDALSKTALVNSEFTISPQSNRMGARLNGPSLIANKQLSQSLPVLPGFIQLLPSGQLIILLQDGQTTGGYPRIGYLSSEDLSMFNQVPIGKSVKFVLSQLE